MTTNVELLPLPSVLLNWPHPTNHVAIRDYARANVSHATAPLQAEIEALRAEVAAQRTRADAMAGEAIKHEARAERLAEALRLIESAKGRGFGIDYARGVAQSTLRDHGQEVDNGWPC